MNADQNRLAIEFTRMNTNQKNGWENETSFTAEGVCSNFFDAIVWGFGLQGEYFDIELIHLYGV